MRNEADIDKKAGRDRFRVMWEHVIYTADPLRAGAKDGGMRGWTPIMGFRA